MTPPTENDGVERRTDLAGERTLLAWWRTGLTAFAVALGVGRVVPELAPEYASWPYALIGIGFALYGIALIVLGAHRLGALGGGAERDASSWILRFSPVLERYSDA